MSETPKKIKRRIAPIQVFDEKKEEKLFSPNKWKAEEEKHMKRRGMEGGRSVKYEKHLKGLHDKDYMDKLEKRAVELGYGKAKKPRSVSGSASKKNRIDDGNHGSHGEHLNDFRDYVKEFAKMKSHSKKESVHDYLKRNFDKGLYFSTATKRFRKLK